MNTLIQKRIHWEWILVPLLTTAYQAFAKLLSAQMSGISFGLAWLEQAIRTPLIAAILACETLSFVLWMRILAVTDVSRAVPLTAVSYVLIVFMGWSLFHEPVFWQEIVGSGLILSGIWVLRRT